MISVHATVNLEVWEGATYNQEFIWKTGDPLTPVNLVGLTAQMHVRDEIADDEVLFDLTTENGGIIIASPTTLGKYAIFLKPEETMGLCPDHEKRYLVYDLFFIHGDDDDVGMQQKGKITVFPAVTRPDDV